MQTPEMRNVSLLNEESATTIAEIVENATISVGIAAMIETAIEMAIEIIIAEIEITEIETTEIETTSSVEAEMIVPITDSRARLWFLQMT